MRVAYNILALLFFLSATAFLSQDTSDGVQECAAKAGPDAIYLEDFQVNLPAAEQGKRPPMFRQAVLLRGNNIYRFNVCNTKGQAVIRIFDSSRMILSSYDAGKDKFYNPVNFLCRKTGQYTIVITFKDGTAGKAIGIMSHVKK